MLNFKLIVTTKGKDLGVAADSSLKTSAQQAEAVKNGQMEHGDKCNDKKPWPKVWTDIKILRFYSDYSNKNFSVHQFTPLQ